MKIILIFKILLKSYIFDYFYFQNKKSLGFKIKSKSLLLFNSVYWYNNIYMDINTIVTVISLIVAVWSILPTSKKVLLKIKFGIFTRIYIFLILLMLLILQFYPTIQSIVNTKKHILRDVHIDDNMFLFLLFLMVIPFLISRRLNNQNLQVFSNMFSELLYEKRFLEITDRISENIDSIKKNIKRKYLFARIEDYIKKFIYKKSGSDQSVFVNIVDPTIVKENVDKKEISKIKKFLNRLKKLKDNFYKEKFNKLRVYLYDDVFFIKDKTKNIDDIFYDLFNSDEYIKYIIENKPDFLVTIFKNDLVSRKLSHKIFREAIKNNKSFLYREFKEGHLFSTGLTSFLFSEINLIRKYNINYSIFKALSNLLSSYGKNKYTDEYNSQILDFDNTGGSMEDPKKMDSPLYVGVWTIKEIILKALKNNTADHMDIYDLYYLIEKIERNLDPKQFVDSEFPTTYHYIVYEIISAFKEIIETIEDDKVLEQENIKIKENNLQYENDNIIKSAIKCIGFSTKNILESNNFSERDKKYFLETIFFTYFNLAKNEKLKVYSDLLLESIKHAGGYSSIDKNIILQKEFTRNFLEENKNFKFKVDYMEEYEKVLKDYE